MEFQPQEEGADSASVPAPRLEGPDLTLVHKPEEPELDGIVEEINCLYHAAPLQLALDIGGLIVDRFYDGDLEAYRKGDIHPSFRKLAAREDLKVSKTALQRSVAVYELCTRLGVPARGHLTLSHLRAVLSRRPEEQERLLDQAQAAHWTTRKLEAETKTLTRPGTGRPPLPHFVKTINRLNTVIGKTRALDDLNDKTIGALQSSEREALLERIDSITAKCELLRTRLAEPSHDSGE